MSRPSLTVAVGCLLVAAAVLLYLEWWRAGELEALNGRVNELGGNVVQLRQRVEQAGRRQPASRGRKRSAAAPTPPSEGAEP